jgi:aminoacylase
MSDMEHAAVTKFREYLKIKTVHPKPDYDGAIQFLKAYADQYGFKHQTFEVRASVSCVKASICIMYQVVPGKPFIMLTLEGQGNHYRAIINMIC